MSTDNVFIITGNKYPNGDPGAVRQHAMAKLFVESGYKPFVIGYGAYTGKNVSCYDGVEYISMRLKTENRMARFFSRLAFGNRLIGFIKRSGIVPDVILVVDVLPDAFRKIEKYAKRHGCVLVHDSVEWYSPEEFKNGKMSIEYRLKEYTNKKAIHSPWRVISISRYLDRYFKGRKMHSVRIPVIMDVGKMECRETGTNEKTLFVYAGGARGRKDYLREILEGYSLLPEELRDRAEFHMVGVDRNTLIGQCEVSGECIDRLGHSLVLHGRLPREQTVKWVRKADFTVLVRNSELRYAKAGFPTKVVESLASGTPVICNLSSDLELYLKNNENALLISNDSPGAIAETLSVAIKTDCTVREKMRKNARKTAEEYFDYRVYREAFDSIIQRH